MFLLIACAIVVGIIYLHYKRSFNLWTSQGINGPTPLPFIGTFFDYLKKPMHEVDNDRVKNYGRVYGTYDGPRPVLVIAEPEIVKHVLVKDFHVFTNKRDFDFGIKLMDKMTPHLRNKEWKRIRSIISPTFTSGKMRRMKPLFMTSVKNATDYLEKVCSTGKDIDLKRFWEKYTMEVIARCCFAADFNFHENEDTDFVTAVKRFFNPPKLLVICFFVLPKFLMEILPKNFRNTVHESINYFESLVSHLLNERKNKPGNYNDFLQLMIEAEAEEKEGESIAAKKLTVDEIVAQSIVFFAAGFETTASTLQYVCYLLALHPEIQDQLYQELIECPDADDIDYDLLNKLPYLDAVISETLRMFPILERLEREAGIDVNYKEFGVKIPEKTLVAINVYPIHHDANYFNEPEVFKPERFLPENRDKINRYTYLPFGGGPRNCVAMRFALIEMKFALFYALRNYKFTKSKNTPEKPIFKKLSGFVNCQNIEVSIIKRSINK